jgi:hypothetical protein
MAALLDGRLGAAEREQLLGELAASEDAMAVYADAAAALAELERSGVVAGQMPGGAPRAVDDARGGTSAPVLSFAEARARRPAAAARGWRVPRWAAAAAAAAVVAVPALWWRTRPSAGAGIVEADGGVPSYAALLAPDQRAVGLPTGWNDTPWGVTRGAGDSLAAHARAVRIGVRVTDLEIAAAAGDTARARAAAAGAAALLDAVPAGGAAALAYRALGAAPDAALLAAARRDAAATAGAEAFALGAWLEAARVAAARRDGAFFRSPASRAAVARASTLVARGGAAEVDRMAAEASREPPDWAALAGALTAALRALGA